jgi:hypothetical protein
VLIRPHEVGSAIEHLRRFETAPQGWLDKIALVWVLQDGGVAPENAPGSSVLDSAIQDLRIAASASLGQTASHRYGAPRSPPAGVFASAWPSAAGAARGMAHLGVLKALEDNGIVPDVIVGTSVGCHGRHPVFRRPGLRLPGRRVREPS